MCSALISKIIINDLKLKLDDDYSGAAWVSGTCERNFNAAIIKDNGWFNGVLTAVHELGHS